MIGFLEGVPSAIKTKDLILMVNGVGYKVSATDSALIAARTAPRLAFYIHTAVREDNIQLFGFLKEEECECFELLITVPGIGPRGALGILNTLTIDTLHQAINSGDTGYLTKISGIGRKTAEKIVIELRGKVGAGSDSNLAGASDAADALRALGYGEREVRETLKNIPQEINSTEAIVREALKRLGQGSARV